MFSVHSTNMCKRTRWLLTQNPLDQRVSVVGCQRAAAIRRQRHCHVAPVGLAAESQLVLKHHAGVWHVAITLGNLLKRRCEKRRVPGMAEHAMLLVDECRRFGLGKRCAACCQQQRKCACSEIVRVRGIHETHSRTGSEFSVGAVPRARLTHIKPTLRVAFDRPPRSVTFLGVREPARSVRYSPLSDRTSRAAFTGRNRRQAGHAAQRLLPLLRVKRSSVGRFVPTTRLRQADAAANEALADRGRYAAAIAAHRPGSGRHAMCRAVKPLRSADSGRTL